MNVLRFNVLRRIAGDLGDAAHLPRSAQEVPLSGRAKRDALNTILYYFRWSRLWPVISLGTGRPSSSSNVGATSARIPSTRRYSGAFAAT
jgi:hypothetical protein